jgi:hypothetical protein
VDERGLDEWEIGGGGGADEIYEEQEVGEGGEGEQGAGEEGEEDGDGNESDGFGVDEEGQDNSFLIFTIILIPAYRWPL